MLRCVYPFLPVDVGDCQGKAPTKAEVPGKAGHDWEMDSCEPGHSHCRPHRSDPSGALLAPSKGKEPSVAAKWACLTPLHPLATPHLTVQHTARPGALCLTLLPPDYILAG